MGTSSPLAIAIASSSSARLSASSGVVSARQVAVASREKRAAPSQLRCLQLVWVMTLLAFAVESKQCQSKAKGNRLNHSTHLRAPHAPPAASP